MKHAAFIARTVLLCRHHSPVNAGFDFRERDVLRVEPGQAGGIRKHLSRFTTGLRYRYCLPGAPFRHGVSDPQFVGETTGRTSGITPHPDGSPFGSNFTQIRPPVSPTARRG